MNRNPNGKGGFQKGVSGNPGGKPKEVREVKALARERTTQALETLTEIMLDKKAPQAARVSAARELLDRGYGRAESSLHAQIENKSALSDDDVLARLTPADQAEFMRFKSEFGPLFDRIIALQDGQSQ